MNEQVLLWIGQNVIFLTAIGFAAGKVSTDIKNLQEKVAELHQWQTDREKKIEQFWTKDWPQLVGKVERLDHDLQRVEADVQVIRGKVI